MARHRSKKKKVKTTRQRAEFVDLPSRDMVAWEADLTKGRTFALDMPGPNDELQGALVKPVIKYNEGDEERARQVEKGMVEHARKFAEHVYPTERVVVRSVKAKMPDLVPALAPLDAAKVWMRERPPKVVGRGDVLAVLKGYLRDVPDGAFDREEPVPFILEWIAGSDFGPFGGKFAVGPLRGGVYSVSARYEGQAGRSNRAGKTALVSVVRQAMYGDLRKGKDQTKLIHGDGDRAVASVQLLKPNRKKLVAMERWVGRSGSGAVVDGDKCNTTRATEEFTERVRLERDDFVKTCFIGEGDLHGVLGQTAAPIMTDMTRWMGLAGWAHVCKATSDELAKLTEKTGNLEAEMRLHEDDVGRGCPSEKEIGRQRVVVAEMGDVAKEGEERRVVVRDLKTRIGNAGRVQEALEVSEGGAALRERLKVVTKARDDAEGNVREPSARAEVLRAEIEGCEEVLAGFDGICPVDECECPRVDEINKNDVVLEKKLKGLKKEKAIADLLTSKLSGVCLRANEEIKDVTRGLRVIADAEDVLEEHGRNPEDARALKRRLAKMESVTAYDDVDFEGAQDKLTGMLADVEVVKRSREKIKELVSAISDMEGRLRLLRYVRLITGRQGIPLMQVQNASRSVEEDANSVLAMMDADHRLEFVFDVALKKKEAECGDCGREFQKGERKCLACGHERTWARVESFVPMVREGTRVQSFDMDSGGGKTLLALAMRIALARFLGLAVLFIDEVCGTLDRTNLEAFINLVSRLKEMGFVQIFIISHREAVKEAFAKNIMITRHADKGWSEVHLEE